MNRAPAVSGSFYPANPVTLQHMLSDFLEQADSHTRPPKAIIVPHAGYIYSGPIAASAYARLKSVRDSISRVVLIGPSHRVAFQGLAVSNADTFTTPLGSIPIDKAAIQQLQNLPFVGYLEQAHALEHSLEVHLPFLQQSLTDFKLVPIVAGNASPDQVSQVIDTLWGGDETLIVISSDLSHYHDYLTAQRLDRQTSDLIEQLNYQNLSSEAACGKVPVSGLLKSLQEKSLSIKTIDLRNSGDTAGDKTRVVGYGAYVVE
ncbi:MAG: AmmeMemoRadiSam system protein B [Methylomonas lenta]|nr:AmmeMemoRadiSam system protein B [Methylomonas lenta]